MVDSIDRATKDNIAEDVAQATAAILELDEVDQLGRLVSGTLSSLVGDARAADVQLGLVPTDADRILRSLRVLIDGGARSVGEASLGVANTLYLTLKLLEIQQLTTDGVRDHTFLAIEEPEAHLHPHVQRNVFSSILRGRAHLPEKEGGLAPASSTILLTTHSPHVASVAKVRSLVLLRSSPSGGSTGVSTADLDISSIDEEDLERYLDVTRAEMLFARAVLLVEGDAEIFVVPRIAQFMGLDLDALGITVCSVGGVNFAPHVKLLKALAIPFAVVTDYDADDGGGSLGEKRVVALMEHLMPNEIYEPATFADVLEAAPASGVFLGSATFEIDLLRSGRVWSMCEALRSATTNTKAKKRAEAWQAAKKVLPDDEERFLKDIEEIGKGRYAQRLASTIKKAAAGRLHGPSYVLDALTRLAEQCRPQ